MLLLVPRMTTEAQQDVVAADDESSFTFDVDGLSDEALDMPICVRYACLLVLHCDGLATRR